MWAFLAAIPGLLTALFNYIQRRQIQEQGRQEVREATQGQSLDAVAKAQEAAREADRTPLDELAARQLRYRRD